MIGLDTNVVIRYLMKDEKNQFKHAEEVIESAIKDKKKVQITLVVLCEVVWVLIYHYELNKDEVNQFLGMLLNAEQIEVENRQLALSAFHEYQNAKADFSDCLIGLTNLSLGSVTTYTFDKKAAKLPFFTAL